MKKSHVASDCHLFLIQPVCSLRYTNCFVMHFSKGKLNVKTNSLFKLLKCQISIIKPHVLLFDCDGIVEPTLLKFLQAKNHDLHHNNLVNLGLTNNTK